MPEKKKPTTAAAIVMNISTMDKAYAAVAIAASVPIRRIAKTAAATAIQLLITKD